MRWIRCSIPVRLMAAVTGRRQGCVVVIGVACCAGHGGMSARQRECRRGMIERGRGPVCCRMADRAISREA